MIETHAKGRGLVAVFLAAVGCLVSIHLAVYQLGFSSFVWDPLFGSASSARVLHSWISRMVPDAALGAGAYAIEVVLGLALLVARPAGRAHAWLSVGYGALAMGMALGGALLVCVQAISLRSFCALCLLSAALSWALATLAFPALVSGARVLIAARPRHQTS